MIRLLEMIRQKHRVKFWLFGGQEESDLLERIRSRVSDSQKVPCQSDLGAELALISRLDFMIAMDSSNMHMAALTGTKVISIWGGTDPLTGFGAWDQPDEYAVRILAEELSCRPCTVYGKGKCRRGDFACMNWLTPEKVYEQIVRLNIL
jgi:ADP-heptose:LPS heptosyltransferase